MNKTAMTDKTFESLTNLYHNMDKTWNKIAECYHFNCKGCEDNCCKSLFFHHTYIEKAYLLREVNALDQTRKRKIADRARTYCVKTFSHPSEIKSLKIFCPVNEDGRCLLYQYRPMICRLHGLPHEINKPGFTSVRGAGCAAGSFDARAYIKFDRTPFYQQMAQIELIFRQHFNKTGKIKQTIAQMLMSP